MSITVKGAGKSLWEPSLDIGRCFVAQVRSFEEMLHIKSGVSPIIADTVEINPAQFEDFVALCLGRLEWLPSNLHRAQLEDGR